ncbi:MAG: transcriptional antiterminator NusG [Alphaproteobacteria bacterium]|jgi:transcriptional antiterminator NusG
MNAEKDGVSHLIEEIFIPKETIKQVKNGKTIHVEKRLFQGYLYLKCDLKNELHDVIKKIPRVSNFLGGSKSSTGRIEPTPVSNKEIEQIKDLVNSATVTAANVIHFDIGESVQVIDGPFQSFSGIVKEVDADRARLKLSISIFNRDTPVDLEYHQVKKNS